MPNFNNLKQPNKKGQQNPYHQYHRNHNNNNNNNKQAAPTEPQEPEVTLDNIDTTMGANPRISKKRNPNFQTPFDIETSMVNHSEILPIMHGGPSNMQAEEEFSQYSCAVLRAMYFFATCINDIIPGYINLSDFGHSVYDKGTNNGLDVFSSEEFLPRLRKDVLDKMGNNALMGKGVIGDDESNKVNMFKSMRSLIKQGLVKWNQEDLGLSDFESYGVTAEDAEKMYSHLQPALYPTNNYFVQVFDNQRFLSELRIANHSTSPNTAYGDAKFSLVRKGNYTHQNLGVLSIVFGGGQNSNMDDSKLNYVTNPSEKKTNPVPQGNSRWHTSTFINTSNGTHQLCLLNEFSIPDSWITELTGAKDPNNTHIAKFAKYISSFLVEYDATDEIAKDQQSYVRYGINGRTSASAASKGDEKGSFLGLYGSIIPTFIGSNDDSGALRQIVFNPQVSFKDVQRARTLEYLLNKEIFKERFSVTLTPSKGLFDFSKINVKPLPYNPSASTKKDKRNEEEATMELSVQSMTLPVRARVREKNGADGGVQYFQVPYLALRVGSHFKHSEWFYWVDMNCPLVLQVLYLGVVDKSLTDINELWNRVQTAVESNASGVKSTYMKVFNPTLNQFGEGSFTEKGQKYDMSNYDYDIALAKAAFKRLNSIYPSITPYISLKDKDAIMSLLEDMGYNNGDFNEVFRDYIMKSKVFKHILRQNVAAEKAKEGEKKSVKDVIEDSIQDILSFIKDAVNAYNKGEKKKLLTLFNVRGYYKDGQPFKVDVQTNPYDVMDATGRRVSERIYRKWEHMLNEDSIGPESEDAESFWHASEDFCPHDINEASLGTIYYRNKYPQEQLHNQIINVTFDNQQEMDMYNDLLNERGVEPLEMGDNWLSAREVRYICRLLNIDQKVPRLKKDRNSILKVAVADNTEDKIVEESLSRWNNLLTEALTPTQKMEMWRDGTRGLNIGACKDAKLFMYREICRNIGFDRGVREIENALIMRGLINRDDAYSRGGNGGEQREEPEQPAQPEQEEAPVPFDFGGFENMRNIGRR